METVLDRTGAICITKPDFVKRQQQLKQNLDQVRQQINELREKRKDKIFTVAARCINPYEKMNLPNISSRAYFKMYEILKRYSVLDCKQSSLQTLHLCEAPGGFVEATLDFVKARNPSCRVNWFGVTLPPNMQGLQWMSTQNQNVIYADVVKESLPFAVSNSVLVTGDGGFEIDSKDRNNQETQNIPLFRAQLLQSFANLAMGGMMAVKFFDMFTMDMCELLWHCCLNFEKVYILKPFGSRICNSEKYVVGVNYNGKYPTALPTTGIDSIIPDWFYGKLYYSNVHYVDLQMKSLQKAIHLANTQTSSSIEGMFAAQQQTKAKKCIDWLQKY